MPQEKSFDAYLDELKTHGFTVVEGVVQSEALARIRKATYAQIANLDPPPPATDDRFGVPDGIAWSEDVCRAVTHPWRWHSFELISGQRRSIFAISRR